MTLNKRNSYSSSNQTLVVKETNLQILILNLLLLLLLLLSTPATKKKGNISCRIKSKTPKQITTNPKKRKKK